MNLLHKMNVLKSAVVWLLISFFAPTISMAQSEADERQASAKAYEISDALLNDTYQKLTKILDKVDREDLLAEQRKWIAERDRLANEAAKSFEDSNLYDRVRHDTMTPLTVDRYAELLKRYLEQYVDVMMAEKSRG